MLFVILLGPGCFIIIAQLTFLEVLGIYVMRSLRAQVQNGDGGSARATRGDLYPEIHDR